jgi:hypothetical protein
VGGGGGRGEGGRRTKAKGGVSGEGGEGGTPVQKPRSEQHFGQLHAPTSFPREMLLSDSGAANLTRTSRGIAGGPDGTGGRGHFRLDNTVVGVSMRFSTPCKTPLNRVEVRTMRC